LWSNPDLRASNIIGILNPLKRHFEPVKTIHDPLMKSAFKGNKQHLPSKPCKACGREMSWRKAWAKNWEQVLYCSAACRKNKTN
jgi:hypothetical protein